MVVYSWFTICLEIAACLAMTQYRIAIMYFLQHVIPNEGIARRHAKHIIKRFIISINDKMALLLALRSPRASR